jgi:predicted ATPase/class 3 adenylate cyclase
MPDRPIGTVTFLFTDIEGSTKLWQAFPDAMPDGLAHHHAILNEAIQAHDGYVFQIIGDAFCAAFSTATDGLDAALAAQRALRDATWGDTGTIRVRMALHTGAAALRAGEFTSGEYVSGLTLSRAARLLSAGHGGQILLSLSSTELVRDHLPKDVTLRDMGARRLKDLIRPEQIFQVVTPDLPAEFAPLKTLDVHPHNLPVQLTSFIGREQEMEAIKKLLSGTHLLTLTGAGGAGKTRLSLQVAADLIDEFPDGVWFVELAPLTDPGLIPQTVASLLGLREEAGHPVMTVLSDYLRAKTTLLLLDNCEHLIDACAKFADAILRAAPKIKILATSREALGIAGETAYRVPSLEIPNPKLQISIEQLSQYDAVRLFVDRALAVKTDFAVTNTNAPAVAQICHRLDGIPLALELAAARVKALSVEQIAARLNDRFRLLTGGSRTALPRQQTLRAAIDWSFSLLTEEERVLLRRLSVFAGGWTLDAAQAVCSCDPICADDVLDLLARLVDKSLVIFEQRGSETRYRLMETIRQYARDRLLESTEGETVRDRHLDFFVAFTEAIEPKLRGPEQPEWGERLELELDNLRSALTWCLGQVDASRAEQAMRLAGALTWFWLSHGYWNEGRTWLERSLDNKIIVPARAKALFGLGMSESFVGNPAKSLPAFDECLALYRQQGDKSGIALAASFRAILERDPARASALFEEAGCLAKELNDEWLLGRRDNCQGIKAWLQKDFASACSHYARALPHARQSGDPFVIGNVLSNWANAELERGNEEQATVLLNEGLEFRRKLGDKVSISNDFYTLGKIAWRRHDWWRAEELFRQAMVLRRDRGNTLGIVTCLWAFAKMAQAQQRLERAVRLLGSITPYYEMLKTSVFNWTWTKDDLKIVDAQDRTTFQENIRALFTQLDDTAFNAAWAEGQKLTLEQAIDLALKDE